MKKMDNHYINLPNQYMNTSTPLKHNDHTLLSAASSTLNNNNTNLINYYNFNQLIYQKFFSNPQDQTFWTRYKLQQSEIHSTNFQSSPYLTQFSTSPSFPYEQSFQYNRESTAKDLLAPSSSLSISTSPLCVPQQKLTTNLLLPSSPTISSVDCSPNVSSLASTPSTSPSKYPLDLCCKTSIKSDIQDLLNESSDIIKNVEKTVPMSDMIGQLEATISNWNYVNKINCNGSNSNRQLPMDSINRDHDLSRICSIDEQIITQHQISQKINSGLIRDSDNTQQNQYKSKNRKESQSQKVTSPILHRLLSATSLSASLLNDIRPTPNINHRHRLSLSQLPSPEKPKTFSTTQPRTVINHIITRRARRSPTFTRKRQYFEQSHTSVCNTNMALLSIQNTNSSKRVLDNDNGHIYKKRCYEPAPQSKFCTSYPSNITRCIDCQKVQQIRLQKVSKQQQLITGCRFQYCRTLLRDNEQYSINGFTTAEDAKDKDLESIVKANSCNEEKLTLTESEHILNQIGKVLCKLVLHEQHLMKNNDKRIWKRCIDGYRETCDECSTTLFNYHYTCTDCGYVRCIECSDAVTNNIEKRKKPQKICIHPHSSFCLSEFIPWNRLEALKMKCIEYLRSRSINYEDTLDISDLPSTANNITSTFIRNLYTTRRNEAQNVQKVWEKCDCDDNPNVEFYCNNRLPVFNEWTTEKSKKFFKKVWMAGAPVLVKNVHKGLTQSLWQPQSFKEYMLSHTETPALYDCETLQPIKSNEEKLTKFWDGFEKLNVRLINDENGGKRRILKLKDWPTKKDFATVFPSLLDDLMKNIPFGDYTRRSYSYNGEAIHGGQLNIVERLPSVLVRPDLGPKLYIAYSQVNGTRQAGTTNLHIDTSDAVNVLVYVGIGGEGENGENKEDEIKDVRAVIESSDVCRTQLDRMYNGELAGALWHLFRADDVPTIRQYILGNKKKTYGTDPIHDQQTYLEKKHLEELEKYGVYSYPIVQYLGDAVFIPSGAPHQVKNLHSCIKIAEDFVSPENIDRCLITTNEFRSLSKKHTNHADILQAKNILYYTVRDALDSLKQ
ncbi:unnamed protein product [Didymodactylos carnosus]|uniref:JmjC domain-containing protein n=1 Tax=Didymodactylos carnosus TaxID=1234261 RepID=A0A814DNQ0_9BILA|nr:unnamed protein product [Didymodactylos carnosus]CAF0959610.1 unnamed protein product [Didymodactylos carnosus]CAF3558735.1 unnamed protein product [Didymodactylos carnosus]CAF3734336.1 unnamed protein product [Didymodactylos carnosus]